MAEYEREFDLVTKRQLLDLAKSMENGVARVQARHAAVVARIRQLAVALVPYAFDQRKRQELVDDWTLEQFADFLEAEVFKLRPFADKDYHALLLERVLERETNRALTQQVQALQAELDGVRTRLKQAEPAPIARRPQPGADALAPAPALTARQPNPTPVMVQAAAPLVPAETPAKPMAITPAETATPEANQRVDDLLARMAATGLTRLPRLRVLMANMWGLDEKTGAFRLVVDAAVSAGYITKAEAQILRGKTFILELTQLGLDRAASLIGRPVDPNELHPARQVGASVDHALFVLAVADILLDSGYRDLRPYPTAVHLNGGEIYQPSLSASAPDGSAMDVMCLYNESLPNSSQWALAARAGGGMLWVVTSSFKVQQAAVSSLHLSGIERVSIAATNLQDIQSGKRAKDGGLWLFRSN